MSDQRSYNGQRELKIYDENGREIKGKTFMTTEQYRVFRDRMSQELREAIQRGEYNPRRVIQPGPTGTGYSIDF